MGEPESGGRRKLALPELEPPGPFTLPETTEQVLPNGLTVIVVRRPSVPLVELRLRVPFGRADLATGSVLAQTVLSGTADRSQVQIAAELQTVGGALAASVDPDRLLLSGNGLVTGLDRMLEVLAEVVIGASYPEPEVATERERLADRIQVARAQPSHLAWAALLRRIYPGHPYAVQTPEPEQVRAVGRELLHDLHVGRLHPAGATLVLVGDLDPAEGLSAAGKALGGWHGGGAPLDVPPVPEIAPGPVVLVDRPEAVQSSLRMALPAIPRTHPDHAALQLANLIFGGYFSSRLVENLREDKGYTYGPRSSVDHSIAGSTLVISAEVSTEVTAPALLETQYELGRLATLPPTEEELTQARQYALGTLQLGMSTQSGVASVLSTYAGFGLRLDYLAEHARRLAEATVADVTAAAARYLAPARAATVILGDAGRIESSVASLVPVVRDAAADERVAEDRAAAGVAGDGAA